MAPVRVAGVISWDLYEEHLDEAAWLWREWEAALDSAVHAIGDVAVGPEERLLAHLDGLVLGGAPVAGKRLRPALTSDDPGAVAAAAWSLLQAEDADHHQVVLDALASAEPPARAAIARALALSPRVDTQRLTRLWDGGGPQHDRAAVFEALARRTPAWVKPRIEPALRSGAPPLIEAALKAVCASPDRALLEPVQDTLRSDDPAVRALAVAAGVALGSKTAWNECRRAAAPGGDAARVPLGLPATSPDPNDRAFVATKARDPASARHALWALGFAGDVPAVEALVASLSAPETAPLGKIAGEALSAITGVVIAGKLAEPGQPTGPQAPEVGDDDPPPVVRTDDFLPAPRADAVAAWWSRERARFHPSVRYIHGLPRSPETLHAALLDGRTWRRGLLKLELGSLAGAAPAVDLGDWAREQLRQLRGRPPQTTPGAAKAPAATR